MARRRGLGERRAQFVGNASNKSALRGDQQLNLRSYDIEVARQISEFVFAYDAGGRGAHE
jgi:hypothetical protein